MAHILDAKMKTIKTPKQVTNEDGSTALVDDVRDVVHEVTFMIDQSTPHTLRFLEAGTELVDGEGHKYVIGDAEHTYHEFHTAEEAVQAYLDGKVK